MYNVNVKNTFGPGSQAGAISEYGSKAGFYGCGFYGYQDTLYANQGTQVYLKGYIEACSPIEVAMNLILNHRYRERLISFMAVRD